MLAEARVLPRNEPIPEGWKPMVSLVTPEGEVSTPHRLQIPGKAREASEIHDAIRANMARGLPEVEGRESFHDRTMVLACFGPSLRDNWRMLAAERGDLWATSGAYAFLMERGIEPYAYTHVDPREWKSQMLTRLCPRTRHFLPSRSPTSSFDRLAGTDLTMYHLRCKQEADVILETNPKAFFVPTAITSGLCALQLGLVLGYRQFVIYGMDGSAGPDQTKHAAQHPNKKEPFDSVVEVNGRQFCTNMLMLLQVEDYFAIAMQHPVGTFQFRGDGMMQWIEEQARKPQPGAANVG